MSDESETGEMPDVIAKARTIMESIEPETLCSGWPCEEIQKACIRLAELEIELEKVKRQNKQ